MKPGENTGPEAPGLEVLRQRKSLKWTAFGEDLLPAWVAETDFLPASPVKEALTEAIEIGDLGYPNPVAAGLGDAFAGFSERQFGWEVDPAQVTAVGDVVGGISSVLDLVTGPGDGVIINPPVYPPFFTLVQQLGRTVIEVPLTGSGGLDLEGIERAIGAGARAILICNPHNPTGTVITPADLGALAEIACEAGVAVISDEIHAPLLLDPVSFTPWLSVSEAARRSGFCVTSASKAFNLPGLSCAVVVTSDAGRAEVLEALPFVATHPAHLGVLASVAAFRECDGWLESLRVVLRDNRELLARLLDERVPEVEWSPPSAGYLAWLDCRATGLGEDPAALVLERGGVALSGGLPFGRGGVGHCRLNFGTSPDLVEMAVEGLARAVSGP